MRLLNAETLGLKEFPPAASGRVTTGYAILSHTWGDEEVTFPDVASYPGRRDMENLKGFAKLAGFCRKAREDGYEWVWIDTCCIDKSSSAELSEAINSMYKWYQEASVCYVYMADVGPCQLQRAVSVHSSLHSPPGWAADMISTAQELDLGEFKRSRWFTRGWTLQELIAPSLMEFYARDWSIIGTKRDLLPALHAATGISEAILRGTSLSTCSVGERMSWAAKRETTRIEDRAYSLLGIFNISLPLLYGEGERAFVRLQEEILRQLEDYTILPWSTRHVSSNFPDWTGCLAASPNHFESIAVDLFRTGSADPQESLRWPEVLSVQTSRAGEFALRVVHDSFLETMLQSPPPSVTPRGLHATVYLSDALDDGNQEYLAWTGCFRQPASWDIQNFASEVRWICIFLHLTSKERLVAFRSQPHTVVLISTEELRKFQPFKIFLATREPANSRNRGMTGLQGDVLDENRFHIHLDSDRDAKLSLLEQWPKLSVSEVTDPWMSGQGRFSVEAPSDELWWTAMRELRHSMPIHAVFRLAVRRRQSNNPGVVFAANPEVHVAILIAIRHDVDTDVGKRAYCHLVKVSSDEPLLGIALREKPVMLGRRACYNTSLSFANRLHLRVLVRHKRLTHGDGDGVGFAIHVIARS